MQMLWHAERDCLLNPIPLSIRLHALGDLHRTKITLHLKTNVFLWSVAVFGLYNWDRLCSLRDTIWHYWHSWASHMIDCESRIWTFKIDRYKLPAYDILMLIHCKIRLSNFKINRYKLPAYDMLVLISCEYFDMIRIIVVYSGCFREVVTNLISEARTEERRQTIVKPIRFESHRTTSIKP